MKITVKSVALFFALILGFSSCKKDDFDGNSGEPLLISASTNTVELNLADRNEKAITFTWNKGLDRGEGTKITYCFEMDIANNDFRTAIPLEELGTDVFEKSLTVRELNDLILNYWGKDAYQPVQLEAKVIARVEADKFIKPEVSKMLITVQPYALTSMPIYLIGDATPAGWNVAGAIRMTEVEPGVKYQYKAVFEPGEYRFIEGRESDVPTYEQGEDETKLVFVPDAKDRYTNFKIEEAGKYEITIDLQQGTHQAVYYPEYERVFMVGDATPNGWEISAAHELEWIEGTDEFVYEGLLNTGQMKFPLESRSWGSSFIMPAVDLQTNLETTEMQVVPPGGVDYKWEITEAAFYKITLNLKDKTIIFEKYGELVYPQYRRVFMVGDATPNGWDMPTAFELKWQINTSLFVFEGYLNPGEMKFPLEEREWSSSFLMPMIEREENLSETAIQTVPPGGVDHKWIITEQTKGNYKVTVDVENMTIKFEKK